MSTKRLSLSIIIGSIFIGSGMAWSDLQPLATPAADSRIDFNQVFADFARRGEPGGLAAENVNRARKADRLPRLKGVVLERVRLPFCEPVASPWVDPILGHIVGRCDT